MSLGIEEEFILVDGSNYQFTPSAQKVLLKLVFKKLKYLKKSSLEIPKSLNNLSKGFSIVEIKTSPHKDIDSLYDELIANRSELAEVVEECNLALLPSGLHPFHDPEICNLENCAAIHIHIGRTKNAYFNILSNIPELIALTANSPIMSGDFLAMSSRAKYSPSVGVPRNFYERNSDLIINKYFGTIELRVCDTQITAKDAISAAATVECIAHYKEPQKVDKSSYTIQRENAINYGKDKLDLNLLYNVLMDTAEEYSLGEWISYFFSRKTGAEWQYECFREHGVYSLLPSLWASMKRGDLIFEKALKEVNSDMHSIGDLIYLVPYSPILIFNILKKMRQDDVFHTTSRFGNNPANLEGTNMWSRV